MKTCLQEGDRLFLFHPGHGARFHRHGHLRWIHPGQRPRTVYRHCQAAPVDHARIVHADVQPPEGSVHVPLHDVVTVEAGLVRMSSGAVFGEYPANFEEFVPFPDLAILEPGGVMPSASNVAALQ